MLLLQATEQPEDGEDAGLLAEDEL